MAKKSAAAISSKEEAFAEIGSTGLPVSSGYVTEEKLDALRGYKAAKVWREMGDNEPYVGAFLFCISMLFRQVPWTVVAFSDATEDQARAEFLEECMNDMSLSWSAMVGEMATMFQYGYAPMELVYKRRGGPDAPDGESRSRFTDGKIGWRKIALRGQETVMKWGFDENGGIRALHQRATKFMAETSTTLQAEVVIPIEKLLLFRTTTVKNNPEGRSLLRNAYRPWYFKKKLEEIEAIGIERGIAGFPVMRVPLEAMDKNAPPHVKAIYDSAKTIVTRIRADQEAGLVLPSKADEHGNMIYDLEFKGIDGRRSADTAAVIERKAREILVPVLADFIMLGHEKVGTFSLSDDKTDMFASAAGAFLNDAADVFNRFAIPRLFAINGDKMDRLPRLQPGDFEAPDLDRLMGVIERMAAVGMSLDEDDEKYLRAAAKLPERKETTGSRLPRPKREKPGEGKTQRQRRRATVGADRDPEDE